MLRRKLSSVIFSSANQGRFIQRVIFDPVGTIFDQGHYQNIVAMNILFKRYGLIVSDNVVKETLSNHKKEHIRKLLLSRGTNYQGTVEKDVVEKDIEKMYKDLIPIQQSIIRHNDEGVIRDTSSVFEYLKLCGTLTSCIEHDKSLTYGMLCRIRDDSKGKIKFDSIIPTDRNLSEDPTLVVKVTDSKQSIEDGKKAGMWTVGVYETSKYVGLSEKQLQLLSLKERQDKIKESFDVVSTANPDFIIASVKVLPRVLRQIQDYLNQGNKINPFDIHPFPNYCI